ncbi:MAG: substrate-binding domain-containing protein [Planctomyces sp.]|nr:substrate-binding domain-containing protein [Planctomyces sp.]
MRRRTLLLLLLALAGCKGSTDTSSNIKVDDSSAAANPTRSSGSLPKIGVSLLSFQNPFFKTIANNIERDAAEAGYTVIALSADDDVAKQSHQVKDFIVQKVAAIVLSPCDSKVIVPIIQEANAAGIPVFTVDIPCREPGVQIASQVATDNRSGGVEAGKAVLETLNGQPGKVAIVHYKTAESCVLRVEGFRAAIEEHNQANPDSQVDIVAELDGGGRTELGYAAGEDLVQAHPDLKAIFAINDPSALGVVAALEKAGKIGQIAVVGFDGQPEGKQAIKDGKIYADPIQFPDRMGQEVVRLIIAYSNGEEIPPEVLIPTELYRKADADQDPLLK